MDYTLIINQILILFIIIFVGYLLKKRGIITSQLKSGLTELLTEIVLPALIISSLLVEINKKLIDQIKVFALVAGIFYIGVIVFAYFISKLFPLNQQKQTVVEFILVFGNVGYMGIPVIDAVFPEIGMYFAVVNLIFFNFFLWTYGVFLFTKDRENNVGQVKELLNNGTIAIAIGLFFFFTDHSLPSAIAGALEIVGDMTFPLSMLVIGSSLAEVKFRQIIGDINVITLTLVRLVLIPFMLFVIFNFINLPGIIAPLYVLLAAMPAAANSVVFAERFGGDDCFASEGVFMSTLFSLFTIPAFVWLIQL